MYQSELIKGAMAEQGLRVEDVAKLSGLSTTTVSFIRNGKLNVKLPSLQKVADALDLELVVKFEKKAA